MRRPSTACVVVVVICSVLTHSWNPPLFVACLNTSVLPPCCLCSVNGALTESGNCSDVWNVSYSSAHYTPGSRRGTRTSIRQKSLLSSFPVRSELMVLHHASALAQESATRIPKWKDLGPLRLPCPGTDEPMATCTVWEVQRGTNVATIPVGGSFEC